MKEIKDIKILLVDDDPFIVDMYTLKFKSDGFQIESCSDGKTALEKVKSYQPDIILLDVVMPVMDGFELLRELKGQKPEGCKILFLTNLGQKEDVEKGMALGADGYIIKAHFTPTEVVAKVKETLQLS